MLTVFEQMTLAFFFFPSFSRFQPRCTWKQALPGLCTPPFERTLSDILLVSPLKLCSIPLFSGDALLRALFSCPLLDSCEEKLLLLVLKDLLSLLFPPIQPSDVTRRSYSSFFPSAPSPAVPPRSLIPRFFLPCPL